MKKPPAAKQLLALRRSQKVLAGMLKTVEKRLATAEANQGKTEVSEGEAENTHWEYLKLLDAQRYLGA